MDAGDKRNTHAPVSPEVYARWAKVIARYEATPDYFDHAGLLDRLGADESAEALYLGSWVRRQCTRPWDRWLEDAARQGHPRALIDCATDALNGLLRPEFAPVEEYVRQAAAVCASLDCAPDAFRRAAASSAALDADQRMAIAALPDDGLVAPVVTLRGVQFSRYVLGKMSFLLFCDGMRSAAKNLLEGRSCSYFMGDRMAIDVHRSGTVHLRFAQGLSFVAEPDDIENAIAQIEEIGETEQDANPYLLRLLFFGQQVGAASQSSTAPLSRSE